MKTQDEDVDETSKKGYVDYSERSFTDLFNIPDYNKIDEDQRSSSSDNEIDTGTYENDEVPPKKRKRENNSKWSTTQLKSKLKRRLACDVVKGITGHGPRAKGRGLMLVLLKMSWGNFYYISMKI